MTSITKPGMVTNLMSYNGLGARVNQTNSAGVKNYMRDGVGVTSPVLSDGNSNFTAGGERTGGVAKTLHSGLKNDDLQTNSSGSVIGERMYDAFGNVVLNSGTWSSHSGYGGQFGYQEDPDSSLKLLGHRYYDSSTGRFLTRDPVKSGRNWFRYAESNPVSRFDPEGLTAVQVIDPIGDSLIWGIFDGDRRYQVGDDRLNWIDRTVKKKNGATPRPTIIRLDPPHLDKGYHVNSDRIPSWNHKPIPAWLQKTLNPKLIKGASRPLLVVAVAGDAISIATADDKAAEVMKCVTVWGGVAVGAAIGSSICPGIGTLLGGVIGGLTTSAIVYYEG